MTNLKFRRIAFLIIFSLVSNVFVLSIFTQQTQAASMTAASMVLYRMAVSRAASTTDPILIIAKPATAIATKSSIKISFAPNFSFATNATLILATTSPGGGIAIPMTFQNQIVSTFPLVSASAISLSGTDVSFTAGALGAGTLYGFFITAGVTNPATTAGNPYVSTITTQDSVLAAVDSSRVATNVVVSGGDQVVVTASVPPTFSFALGSNTIALGDLSTSSTKNGNVVTTISTNANNGYVMWLRGSGGSDATNASLASAGVSDTVLSQGTIDNTCTSYVSGTAYYQLTATFTHTAGNGTISTNPEYGCGSSNTSGGTITKLYQEVERSSGTASGDTVTLTALAAAASLNKAATDYTDTWTVIGAGNF